LDSEYVVIEVAHPETRYSYLPFIILMSRRLVIRNEQQLRFHLSRRLWLAGGMAVLISILLLVRFSMLQLIHHDHYALLSQNNRFRIRPLPPSRGLILDRHGAVIAANEPAFRLDITPENVPDLQQTLTDLQRLLGLSQEELEQFKKTLRQSQTFDAIPLKHTLSEEQLARFAVNQFRFPGVDVRAELRRTYPAGQAVAHILGYLGAIDQQDLSRLDRIRYGGATQVGKTGIEKQYEDILYGIPRYQRLEVNASGRSIRQFPSAPPERGHSLYLTIDLALQEKAQGLLAGRRGSIVALDVRDGSILAMASAPSYDPGIFSAGTTGTTYHDLQLDQERPLLNRAIQGVYAPGSTIKPFLGLAEFYYNKPQGTIYCRGVFYLQGRKRPYRDWRPSGHGAVNLRRAIEQSCDIYFYSLAQSLGIDRISHFLGLFGFGKPTGLDMPGERPGLVPTPQWKRSRYRQPWYMGDTVVVGIGQGYMQVTPLQLAQATATLARHGEVIKPHLLMAMEDPRTRSKIPQSPETLPAIDLPDAAWDTVIGGMTDVIMSPSGTAHRIGINAAYTMAGKSGTAQVIALPKDKRHQSRAQFEDNALFISFAPVEDPRIAVAVVLENAGGGSSMAAPLAREIMDTYLLEINHERETGPTMGRPETR
jgi:penicillin-binding protein 2